MRVTGVIERIELQTVPSKFLGQQGHPVARLSLMIDSAVREDGSAVDRRDLIGLPFEGPPELIDRFVAGTRVAIETTTPTGLHIARIDAAPLS
ncbi:MAG TPA: hypothetical protein VML75_27535 [Kofleriaceae bacterium]|nr:hypothetical protein [Kofleriaceae bacterium]